MDTQIAESWHDELPVHFPSMIRKILERRFQFIGLALCSLLAAAVISYFFSNTWWKSQNSLLYVLEETEDTSEGLKIPPLATLSTLVLSNENLTALREELSLEKEGEALKRQFEITMDPNKSLLHISARTIDPVQAANLVNSMSNIFTHRIQELRSAEAKKLLNGYDTEIDRVRQQIESIETALQRFSTPNEILDLERGSAEMYKEFSEVSSKMVSTDLSLETRTKQLEELANIRNRLQSQIDTDAEMLAKSENIYEVKLRSDRLREKIKDDKSLRSNKIRLEELQAKLERAESLYNKGILSKQKYEEVKSDFERHRAVTVDTEEITVMRKELEELDKVTMPNQGVSSASRPLMNRMMEKSFNLQLEITELKEKKENLKRRFQALQSSLQTLPDLQTKHSALKRELDAQEGSLKRLLQLRDLVQSHNEANGSGFVVASRGVVPQSADIRTAPLWFVGLFALFWCCATLWILAQILWNEQICTAGDVAHTKTFPVISELGQGSSGDTQVTELARRVRCREPDSDSRVVVFCEGGVVTEKTAALWEQIAFSLALLDEQVLCIDLLKRNTFLSEIVSKHPGVTDYLSFKAASGLELVRPAPAFSIDYIPRGETEYRPEILYTEHLKTLLDELRSYFTMILVFAGHTTSSSETRAFAELAEATYVFMHSGKASKHELTNLNRSAQDSSFAVEGIALYDVKSNFLNVH